MDNRDEKYMRYAIAEVRRALSEGEVPIGAVVVGGDQILGRGHNLVERLSDATAHAEMQAITAACSTIGGKYLGDCALYVTVEPCAMCAGAIAWSQVGEVIFGASDPKRGFMRYSHDILHPKTKLRQGELEEECRELMQDFFRNLRQ